MGENEGQSGGKMRPISIQISRVRAFNFELSLRPNRDSVGGAYFSSVRSDRRV